MIFMLSFHLGERLWSLAFAPFMWQFGKFSGPVANKIQVGPFSFLWGLQ